MKNNLDTIGQQWCEEDGFERCLTDLKIKELKTKLPRGRLLDLGCGTGLVCRGLGRRFSEILGVDGSEWKIKRARELTDAPHIHYMVKLFEEFETKDKYEAIVMTNVLEHVDHPVALLRRVKGWLAPRGVLGITVPNALGLHKRIGLKMGLISDLYALTAADVSKGHQRIYDSLSLRRDLEEAELKVFHLSGLLLKTMTGAKLMEMEKGYVDALLELGRELPEYCSSLLALASEA
jgi:2-polyprenyl-3-methyl-5-hydroxy-6-metoxy-1,4-benzoquinol methylase